MVIVCSTAVPTLKPLGNAVLPVGLFLFEKPDRALSGARLCGPHPHGGVKLFYYSCLGLIQGPELRTNNGSQRPFYLPGFLVM